MIFDVSINFFDKLPLCDVTFQFFIFTCTFICTLSLSFSEHFFIQCTSGHSHDVSLVVIRFTVCQFAPSTMFNRFVCLLTFLLRFSLGQFLLLFKFPRMSVRQSVRTVLVLSSYISPLFVRSYGVSLDLSLCYYFISFIQCKAIIVLLFIVYCHFCHAPFLSTPVRHLHNICIVFL